MHFISTRITVVTYREKIRLQVIFSFLSTLSAVQLYPRTPLKQKTDSSFTPSAHNNVLQLPPSPLAAQSCFYLHLFFISLPERDVFIQQYLWSTHGSVRLNMCIWGDLFQDEEADYLSRKQRTKIAATLSTKNKMHLLISGFLPVQ